jgi:hypothetical protein
VSADESYRPEQTGLKRLREANPMLYEAQVVDRVCGFLRRNNFREIVCIPTNKRGEDIKAIAPDKTQQITIEAKGGTSSDPESKRYGKPFDSKQVLDHVAKAVYCAARYSLSGRLSGVAFPKDEHHMRKVNDILQVLKRLRIEVFWVTENGKVEVAHHWNVWD